MPERPEPALGGPRPTPRPLGPNELVLLVDEPAVDENGNATWIDVVEGDGVLVRVLGQPTVSTAVQYLRDGNSRTLGGYFSTGEDHELGIPFRNGIQAKPLYDSNPKVSIMLIFRRTGVHRPVD